MRVYGWGVIIVALAVVAACKKEQVEVTSRGGDTGSASPATGPAELPDTSRLPPGMHLDKVELRDGEGVEVFAYKPSGPDSVKFYDRNGKELCKLTFVEGKLKAKSPDDQPLFELKKKDDKVMIKDASGEEELFKFKLKGEDLDFYAPGDLRLYRIRKKDYGYALEDNQDRTLFRARIKDGKMVLRNPDDVTVLACKDIMAPLGLVFFRMKELTPQQQAACFLFFLPR